MNSLFLNSVKYEKSFRILIVDDDSISLLMLENLLRYEGYQTVSAGDGLSVYQLIREKDIDLVLLDVNLPVERGPQICKKLKTDPLTSDIPIIFLSVENDIASKVECFDAGGQDYITKPYEPQEVLARVRTHLNLSKAQRMHIKVLSEHITELCKAQQVLLPVEPSEMPNAKFAVHYKQLTGAGGDFYDIEQIGDDVFDYIVADVCGHGLGTAFVTAALKTLLVQNCSLLNSPVDVLKIINRVLPSVLDKEQYICISILRINRLSLKAFLLNAGQPPVIYLPCDNHIQRIDASSDVIGIFDNVTFEQKELSLRPGDKFVMCTDGLVEITEQDSRNRNAGIEKLMERCIQFKDQSVTGLVEKISSETFKITEPIDDVIVLAVEV